jgi:ribose-phosphate pyrophosphokinase
MSEQYKEYPLPKSSQDLYGSFYPKHVDPESFVVIAGRGNEDLARSVGNLLDVEVDFPCSDFANGETKVQVHPNLRGKEVFVINSMQPHPNRGIQETVLMGDTARRAAAAEGKITAILPKIAYDRQDRKPTSRTPISIAALSTQLRMGGMFDRLFTIDVHAEQSVGSFPGAWDNVFGSKVLVPAIEQEELDDPMVVAPDAGSGKRAEKYNERLAQENIAIVYKRRDREDPSKSESLRLAGDVKDRDVVIVDDVIGSGGTLLGAAEVAKQNGARKVIAAVTHAELVADRYGITLPERLNDPNCPLDKLLITDTIFQSDAVRSNDRIEVVSVAPILAVAILCYLTNDSIGRRLIN